MVSASRGWTAWLTSPRTFLATPASAPLPAEDAGLAAAGSTGRAAADLSGPELARPRTGRDDAFFCSIRSDSTITSSPDFSNRSFFTSVSEMRPTYAGKRQKRMTVD